MGQDLAQWSRQERIRVAQEQAAKVPALERQVAELEEMLARADAAVYSLATILTNADPRSPADWEEDEWACLERHYERTQD